MLSLDRWNEEIEGDLDALLELLPQHEGCTGLHCGVCRPLRELVAAAQCVHEQSQELARLEAELATQTEKESI